MKWGQYRLKRCVHNAFCHGEATICTIAALHRSMTVGDCVLIKLQSHFSMDSSDCAVHTMTFHRSIWVCILFFCIILLCTLFPVLMPFCLPYETMVVSNSSMQSNYYWTDTIPRHAFISNLISFFMPYGKYFISRMELYSHFAVRWKLNGAKFVIGLVNSDFFSIWIFQQI